MPPPDETAARRAEPLVKEVNRWFRVAARDLPWRRPGVGAWPIMVSEFMLQQTPVARVLEPWRSWVERWPTPASLAIAPVGEAVRQWGRLGYPRRALRLHAAAVAITEQHDGEVPSDHAELLALPGVGDYTAAAISAFAFGGSHVVLDTNVRRVLGRTLVGQQFPPTSPTAAERRLAADFWPEQDAALFAAASMELGALVCTAINPSCEECPVQQLCAWYAAGRPAHQGPPRRGQAFAGTDRQVRGRLLAVLRDSDEPVPADRLDVVWPDEVQRRRALESLLADGLVARQGALYRLP